MHVFADEDADGTLSLTVTIADEDHRFEVWQEGSLAAISYEETLLPRGRIEVSEPDEDVFKAVMTCEDLTHYLDRHDLEKVVRHDRVSA